MYKSIFSLSEVVGFAQLVINQQYKTDKIGISFKSKNKLSVLRKMEQLKKMTIKFKNEKNRN